MMEVKTNSAGYLHSLSTPKPAAFLGGFSAVAIGAAYFAFANLFLYPLQGIPLRQHLGDMVNFVRSLPVIKFQYHRVALPAVNAGVS